MKSLDYFIQKHSITSRIEKAPHPDLGMAIVIPCFNEPELLKTIQSLRDCDRPEKPLEVIVVFNSGEKSSNPETEQNQKSKQELIEWKKKYGDDRFRVEYLEETHLPEKLFGAGYARRTGMNQAALRFRENGNEKGIIVSLDADTVVEPNYLRAIEDAFGRPSDPGVATIYFEHPLDGIQFNADIYEGIAQYELYLRYYHHAMAYAGFPYPYYTVGSCFAVRAGLYAGQGGMNSRQGGEDFYFLHKIFPTATSCVIRETIVYPSPRISNRVPFGTGPAIKKWIEEGKNPWQTYNITAYEDLKILFDNLHKLYNAGSELVLSGLLSEALSEFLEKDKFRERTEEIKNNVSSYDNFVPRFYRYFNAFKILKYLNFSHSRAYKKTDLIRESRKLLAKKYGISFEGIVTAKRALTIFREKDRIN